MSLLADESALSPCDWLESSFLLVAFSLLVLLSITDSLLTTSFSSITVVFFSSVSFEVSIALWISSCFSLFSFCLSTTFSLSEILKASSELDVSAKTTSLGTYAAKITAAVVNDNTVLFFILIPYIFI